MSKPLHNEDSNFSLPHHPFNQLEYNVYSDLLKSRKILLNGDVCENIIEKAVIPLLHFERKSKTKPITIFINSYGGQMEDGQSVVDVIRSIKPKVTTIAFGKAMSAAFDIFLAGDKRIIYENTILMCHSGSTSNQNSKPLPFYNIDARVYEEYYKRWAAFYASRTKISEKEWLDVVTSGKDRYFFSEEALDSGLAHEVRKPF